MAPRIAIVGGGPSGLCLAALLQRAGLSFTVFEAAPSPASPIYDPKRSQGGSLDIHHDSGQVALKEAGLEAEFWKIARNEEADQSLKVFDKHEFDHMAGLRFGPPPDAGGAEQLGDDLPASAPSTPGHGSVSSPQRGHGHGSERGRGGPHSDADAPEHAHVHERPEVDRRQLSDMLAAALAPDSIRWEHRLERASRDPGGQFALHFRDRHDTDERFDLVIGADGTWSKTRQSIVSSTLIPQYAGVEGIECSIPPERVSPATDALVSGGTASGFDDCKGLMCQRQSDRSVRVYYMQRSDEPTSLLTTIAAPHDLDTLQGREQLIANKLADWGPRLQNFIRETDPAIAARGWPLYHLDVQTFFGNGLMEDKGCVTLIGDAAHCMPPFAGEGVNMALVDSLELSKEIVAAASSSLIDLAKALRRYEEKMVKRMIPVQAESVGNMEAFFQPNGARAFRVVMEANVAKAMAAHNGP